jgi:hypothetical protein
MHSSSACPGSASCSSPAHLLCCRQLLLSLGPAFFQFCKLNLQLGGGGLLLRQPLLQLLGSLRHAAEEQQGGQQSAEAAGAAVCDRLG